ncbi:MAG: chromate transporter [Bacillota bacterium]|jgi:chromate transporter
MSRKAHSNTNWNWRLLWDLFLTFLRIGAFTIGGGYAMLPLIQKETVEKKKWVGEEEFAEIIGLSQTAPGAIAINSSIYLGYRVAAVPGAIFAVSGMVVPSLVIILTIAVFFDQFSTAPAVKAIFNGVRPAVMGLILAALFKIGKSVLKNRTSIIIFAVMLLIGTFLDLHPVPIILMAALAGIIFLNNKNNKDKEAKKA